MKFSQTDNSFYSAIERCWPIGSIFLSVLSTNPVDQLGFGTWVAFAVGRCLVGVDISDSDFDVAEKTSGSKTVILTTNQIPAHSHTVNDPGHFHLTQSYPTATGGSSGFTADTSMSGTPTNNTLPTASTTTGISINNTGSNEAHNNVQPSIAIFMWKRTA